MPVEVGDVVVAAKPGNVQNRLLGPAQHRRRRVKPNLQNIRLGGAPHRPAEASAKIGFAHETEPGQKGDGNRILKVSGNVVERRDQPLDLVVIARRFFRRDVPAFRRIIPVQQQ
ncbi:MAG: hypothetical protein PHU71_07010 [Candidatus Gracilibacteria bacterium]|nr:hypothetical protein [Candidatus Gracilibacteria bacterium]